MSSIDTPNTHPALKPTGALKSLSAKNTTGAGTGYALGGAFKEFSLQLYRASTGSSGGSTKASVRLQGSLDGNLWYTLGASTIAVTSVAGSLVNRTSTAAVTYVRLSINSFSTSSGSNPDKVKITGLIAAQGV